MRFPPDFPAFPLSRCHLQLLFVADFERRSREVGTLLVAICGDSRGTEMELVFLGFALKWFLAAAQKCCILFSVNCWLS